MVLSSTGITHNILQPHIAHYFNLAYTLIPYFSVMVGNGKGWQTSMSAPSRPALQKPTKKWGRADIVDGSGLKHWFAS